MNSTVEIYFSIRSDTLTPDYLTNYLKIQPSSFCMKGDVNRKGQTPFLENVWTIMVNNNDFDMEGLMQKLVDILFESKLKLIKISHQCLYDVECVVHLDSSPTTPIINYKKNIVQFFAEIGADLGVEVYA